MKPNPEDVAQAVRKLCQSGLRILVKQLDPSTRDALKKFLNGKPDVESGPPEIEGEHL